MDQYQKSYSAKINEQINFVIRLSNDLKEQILSTQNLKDQDFHIFKLFKEMELYLKSITPLNEQIDFFDLQDCPYQSFQRKSFSQIVGLSQSQSEQLESFKTFHSYSSHSLKNLASIRGPYRSYCLEEKLKVLQLYREGRNYAFISRYLQIPQKNIVRWCKNGVLRKQGAGRKIGDEQMQQRVLKWIRENFEQGHCLSPKQIRRKAIEYSKKEDFKSSKGWLKNFIKRHKLNQNYDI